MIKFNFLTKKISGRIASGRLKQLLLADRIHCPVEISDQIKRDIINVLKKYAELDTDQMQIRMMRKNTEHLPFLLVSVPLKQEK